MKGFNQIKKALIMRSFAAMHYVVMVLLFALCWSLFYPIVISSSTLMMTIVKVCIMYGAFLIVFERIYSAYMIGLYRISDLIYCQALSNLISLGLTYIMVCLLTARVINPLAGFGIAAVQFVFSICWTMLANRLYYMINDPKSAVVIYRNENDLVKLNEIKRFSNRWIIKKMICWPAKDAQQSDRDAVYYIISRIKNYDVVFISGISATLRNGIVKYCIEEGMECYFVPHTGDVITAGAKHIQAFAIPICHARRCTPTPGTLFIKRLIDIVVSSMAIVIFSPLMLITAIVTKAYDRGPVLYKQVRLTKDKKQFMILKFRSMRQNAESDGVACLSNVHDDRITPVGRIIRAIRIDEFPQLFNILKGDMSLVGPRPERPEIAEQYSKQLPAFDLRLQVKAGLTGYAQIYGRYNTEPSDKLKMDLMYINNLSVLEDIRLILATIRVLFMWESTQGVAEGQTTAAKEIEKSA